MKNFSFLNFGSVILIIFLMVFVTSVQEEKVKAFYDSLPKVKNKFKVKQPSRKENTLERISYEALYIGNAIPEIKIDRGIYSDEESDYVLFSFKEKRDLKIIVDTTQNILKKHRYSREVSEAYPVFLYNSGIKRQVIGFGEILFMHLEAKDDKGEWKPIEKQNYYSCGTGIYNFFLDKNEICVSSVYKYSGSFKTKLRLKHSGNYSNEFEGYVNLDEFGEYEGENKTGFSIIKK